MPIDHGKHVPVPFSQSSAESEYNTSCNAVMALAHFRVLIHESLNKDPDIVPEEAHLIILDSKYDVCMTNNVRDNKHTRHISSRVKFLINGDKCKIHNINWCEGSL